MSLDEIFPHCQHIRVVALLGLSLAGWPLVNKGYPTVKRIYKAYSNFIMFCFIGCMMAVLIELITLFKDETALITEFLENLSVCSYGIISIIKALLIRTARIKALVTNIINWEKRIITSRDELIVQIYTSCAKLSRFLNTVFLITLYCALLIHFLAPLFMEDTVRFYESRNETVIKKPLPVPLWSPFDDEKQYLLTCAWQMFFGYIGATFAMYTDLFTHSLIIFAVGQLKILRHLLINFDEYVYKMKNNFGYGLEEARFVTMRECILRHKAIISYVDEFNNTMRYSMLLDFLHSSIQLAALTLRLMLDERTVFNVALAVAFASSMLIRLVVSYWFANEILLQSTNLSLAIYESNWHEQPLYLQKMLLVMMMRCNRELSLQVGPFTTMTLATFLGILKATYSYMTIFV